MTIVHPPRPSLVVPHGPCCTPWWHGIPTNPTRPIGPKCNNSWGHWLDSIRVRGVHTISKTTFNKSHRSKYSVCRTVSCFARSMNVSLSALVGMRGRPDGEAPIRLSTRWTQQQCNAMPLSLTILLLVANFFSRSGRLLEPNCVNGFAINTTL